MSRLTNCAKMRILKMGVSLFKFASCIYCLTFFSISLLSRVHDTFGYFEMQKRVVMSFYVLKKINKKQVAG